MAALTFQSELLPTGQVIQEESVETLPGANCSIQGDEGVRYFQQKSSSGILTIDEWIQYSNYYVRMSQITDASKVFSRALHEYPVYSMWAAYLSFSKTYEPKPVYYRAVVAAITAVGVDLRSGLIWQEVLQLKIKAFNAAINRDSNNSVSRRFIPNPFARDLSSIEASNLLPSSAEEEQILVEVFPSTEIYSLRNSFLECLSTPTAILSQVWSFYAVFERIVGHPSQSTIRKFISAGQEKYNLSKSMSVELQKLYSHINFEGSPVRITKSNAATQAVVAKTWRAILTYEQSNPMQLECPRLKCRIVYSFINCLMTTCAYTASLWFEFFQCLRFEGLHERATAVLRKAVQRFLPKDEMLKLLLASHYEDQNDIENAKQIYTDFLNSWEEKAAARSNGKNVVDRGDGLLQCPSQSTGGDDISADVPAWSVEGIEGSVNEEEEGFGDRLTSIPLVCFLSFLCRNYDIQDASKLFDKLIKLRNCPWQVYAAQIKNVWCLLRDLPHATQIVNLGIERYSEEPQFIGFAADFSVEVGDLPKARQILLRGVLDVYRESGKCCEALWDKLIRLEQFFGTRVKLKMAQFMKHKQQMGVDIEGQIASSDFLKDATKASVCDQLTEKTENAAERMLGCGGSFSEYYSRFRFMDSYPSTADAGWIVPHGVSSQEVDDDKITDAKPAHMDSSNITAEDLPLISRPFVADLRRSPFTLSVPIFKPDITKLAVYKPALSNMLSKSLPSYSNGVLLPLVPKAIYDLLAVLPNPRYGCNIMSLLEATDRQAIDKIMVSLQKAKIPKICLFDFRPIRPIIGSQNVTLDSRSKDGDSSFSNFIQTAAKSYNENDCNLDHIKSVSIDSDTACPPNYTSSNLSSAENNSFFGGKNASSLLAHRLFSKRRKLSIG